MHHEYTKRTLEDQSTWSEKQIFFFFGVLFFPLLYFSVLVLSRRASSDSDDHKRSGLRACGTRFFLLSFFVCTLPFHSPAS